jgi:tripartite-type tricarboxylate transporter receptor subunit TctC
MRMRKSIVAVLCAAAVVTNLCAHAQDYPARAVQLISPTAAGNAPDVITRIVADRLSQMWKQQVVVINRPGAGGMLGVQAAAGQPADGYTLFAPQASVFTVLPVDQAGKMPVDLQKAFVPAGLVGEWPIGMVVNRDVPANSIAELIALANKAPEGMLFGATNRGGQAHLTGELFRERSKAKISFVHAAGAAASLNDVIAGRIPIMFEGLASLAPGIQSGSVKLIGVAAQKRLPDQPNVPAINETVPGVVSSGWVVLMAPAGTPHDVIQRINADMRKVVGMPDVVERFLQLGIYSRDLTPAQTEDFVRGEEQLWWPIARSLKQ